MPRTDIHKMREARRHTTDGLLSWLKPVQPENDEQMSAIRSVEGMAYGVVYLSSLR